MTEQEFLALEPRERDAVVAEARGWRWDWDGMDGNCWWTADGKQAKYGSGGSSMAGAHSRSFTPTEQIAHAWELVEEMGDYDRSLEECAVGWYFAFEEENCGYWGQAETVPLAICIAYLKAKGVVSAET